MLYLGFSSGVSSMGIIVSRSVPGFRFTQGGGA